MIRRAAWLVFYVSVVAVAWFLATYEFPRVVGFTEFPFSAELTRETMTRNLLIAGGLVLGAVFTWVLGSRTMPLGRFEVVRLFVLSAAIWTFVYTWNPVGRVVWGDPFGPTGILEFLVAGASATLFIAGTIGRHGFVSVVSMVAVVLAVWLKMDMSLDRLVIALLATLGVGIWATGLASGAKKVEAVESSLS